MAKRAVIVASGVLGVWLIALVVLGAVMGGRQERATRARLGASLGADVTTGNGELALVRGRFELERVAARRDDRIGHLALDVRAVRCELAPLGWALVDRDCRELAVRGTRLEVSSAALFQLERPHHDPIRARRVVIEDAVLVFMPSAFAPGLGRVEIAIEHARAGATVFKTPLSWLFALDELRARFELPPGITVRVAFRGGKLRVSGSVFGAEPVELPFELPVAGAARDAREEIELLVRSSKDLAERLIAQRAKNWLKSKLP
jgi:hypothetical protein